MSEKKQKETNTGTITDIVFIIDRSGSMYNLTNDTIGGFNSFIESQKELDGKVYLTTVLFSGTTINLHERVDLREVTPMTRSEYITGGQTALFDAIGRTINTVQKQIDSAAKEEIPDKVICAIITDGEENCSLIYKKSDIESMIKHQTMHHNWEFIFLGATMEAVVDAKQTGIANTVLYTANSIGTTSAYKALDTAIRTSRITGSIDNSWKSYIN